MEIDMWGFEPRGDEENRGETDESFRTTQAKRAAKKAKKQDDNGPDMLDIDNQRITNTLLGF